MSARIGDWVARILAIEWLALAIGAALIIAGLWIGGVAGAAVVLAGVVLAIGGTVHLVTLAGARRRFPPAGQRVAVPGGRMHVLAEGDAQGTLPIVLLGGGHSAGVAMDHLHRVLRTRTRSILIDRLGTGWSDTGPFPRTTVREVDEVVAALTGAGERGPFVFAGYSFGGLLAANIARRHPALVARLVLIDPTPLETLVFGPRLAAVRHMRRDALLTALARLVGLRVDFQHLRMRRADAGGAANAAFERVIGDALPRLRGREVSAGAKLAEWSIYRELLGPHIGGCGWETVVYDGDLGDMSVWLVAPGSAEEVGDTPEIRDAGADAQRMFRFFQRSRERYMATSTNARRIVAPPGSTHQFVYEQPDFVGAVLVEAVIP